MPHVERAVRVLARDPPRGTAHPVQLQPGGVDDFFVYDKLLTDPETVDPLDPRSARPDNHPDLADAS